MRKLALGLVITLACAPAGEAAPSHVAVSSGVETAMLPARTLRCTLGRALNLDPSKFQSTSDITYEGSYAFALYLPAGPKRQGPPPDPADPPEPVDSATRVLEDPAGLARDMQPQFARVVDLWPERIEMIGQIDPEISRLIVISEIDPQKGVANLFMTRARDAASLDLDNVYQGACRIETTATHAELRQAPVVPVRHILQP